MSHCDLPAAHHHCHCPNQTLPLASRLCQLDGFSEENPRESDTDSQGQSPRTWCGPQHPQTLPSPFKKLSFCHSSLPWGPLSWAYALSIVTSWCGLRYLTLPHNGNWNLPTIAQTRDSFSSAHWLMRIIVPILHGPSPRGSIDNRFQVNLKPVSCWLKGKSLQKLTSLTFAGCSVEPRLHNYRGCTPFLGRSTEV